MSDCIEKTVKLQSVNLADYAHEEVCARVNQIVDPSHALRDVEKTHCFSLPQLSCNYALKYLRDRVSVYLLAVVSPVGVTYVTVVHSVDFKKAPKDDYLMFMLDGCHRPCLMKISSDENCLTRTTNPLRTQYAFRIDEKPITTAQRIKLRKTGNNSTAMVRRETRLTYTIQCLLNYARAL